MTKNVINILDKSINTIEKNLENSKLIDRDLRRIEVEAFIKVAQMIARVNERRWNACQNKK
jgi:hypothetical protein